MVDKPESLSKKVRETGLHAEFLHCFSPLNFDNSDVRMNEPNALTPVHGTTKNSPHPDPDKLAAANLGNCMC